jgi:predicted secreted Zn-dependent protease
MQRARFVHRAAAAVLSLALLAQPAVRAEVLLLETRSDYVLEGTTAAALREQLQKRLAQRASEGGVTSHGLTRAALETRYELEPGDGSRCVLEDIEVRLTIDTLLPSWRASGRPDPGLRPRVEAMLAGLARHEAGHREHVLETAGAVDAGLRAMPPASSCRELGRAAQRLVSRALIKLRVNEWNYDAATQGGRRQGAVLAIDAPPSRGRGSTPRR